ncbi:MAG: hypothetical protein V3T23_02175 [Nitrososphaerales archaeon]
MKKKGEMDLLLGQHEVITAMDFRKSPGEVFDQVEIGKKFTITRAGKPIALLSRYRSLPDDHDKNLL